MKQHLTTPICVGLLLVLLASCTSLSQPEPVVVTVQVTAPPIQRVVTPVPSVSAVGRIEEGQIASRALAANLIDDSALRTYNVYLPPSYDTSQHYYPVVYLLHGHTQTYRTYVGRVNRAEDLLIATGEAREMIVVFVDGQNRFGGSWYLSSPTIGDYETYVTKELVAEIDGKYRTRQSPGSRGITGCSMGGYGSVHLAFKYPEVFSVAAAMSGVYDWVNPGWEGDANAFLIEPKSWSDWDGLQFVVQADLASAAGAAPNPDKPPFYLDMPFELVEGKGQIVPEVYQKINAKDAVHDLNRYLTQPVRLKGLMIYHGSSDYPEDARAFDKTLSEAGVEHTYVEVEGGGHCDLDWAPILKFMSDHLIQ